MRDYQYVCPDCSRQLGVDGSTREAIIASGCPFCAAPARADAFVLQPC